MQSEQQAPVKSYQAKPAIPNRGKMVDLSEGG